MNDVFFISFDETNADANWETLKSFEPAAIRIHGISGIDTVHKICNDQAKSDFFFTVDGDNKVLRRLNDAFLNPTADLTIFFAKDPIFGMSSGLGGIKLWRKNKMSGDMSHGDFCTKATDKYDINHLCLSEHAYNSSPYETWRATFRYCIKTLYFFEEQPESRFVKGDPIESSKFTVVKRNLTASLTGSKNSIWVERATKDALEFDGDRNVINSYADLKKMFDVRYHSIHS